MNSRLKACRVALVLLPACSSTSAQERKGACSSRWTWRHCGRDDHGRRALVGAAVAKHFGVRVVLVSGDNVVVDEVHRTIDPNIVGDAVKRAIGYHSADSVSPDWRPAVRKGLNRRAFLCGVLVAMCVAAAPTVASAQKAVFVVRHAEKADESDDPVLSPSGRVRAQALARHLATAGIKAIYVTQYQRTVLTAAPLSSAIALTPIAIHSDATQELVDRMRKDTDPYIPTGAASQTIR